MEQKEFENYLDDRYKKAIYWYDNRATRNKQLFYLFQTLIIVVSAITPVLAIIQLKWPTTIAASLVAISTGIIKFMKFEENWLSYRTICETLKKEPYLMKAELSDYAFSDNRYKLFVDRVESLISRENTLWLSTATTREEE